jgi:citrate lyase subunit beta / citryl-CoA lyase
MQPVSYLYVPGDRPERFSNALASDADAVIFDLEDAVAVPMKDYALEAVVAHLQQPVGKVEQWVRINTGERGIGDLGALADLPGLTGIFVPKATRATLDELATVADVARCALIETAAALLELPAIAAAHNIAALAMGEVDLAADLGVEPSPNEHELWPLRMQVVVASAAADGQPPIGPVSTDIKDLYGLGHSTEALRRAGFGARQAIHPSQVPVINLAFTPTAKEVERAEALLARAQSDDGVWVDESGRMVDEAVLRSARRVLARRRSN